MSMRRKTRNRPAKNVDDYLAAVPEEARTALEKLRKTIKATAPKAEETISYQIPTFVYHGPLVYFAAFKDHCSFFPGSQSIIKKFRGELKLYDAFGGTIHFTVQNPLPMALVKKIVRARMKQNEARAKNVIDENAPYF
jgi:uncharacterized protein YdhG (YjbR/CyaY superfamily)